MSNQPKVLHPFIFPAFPLFSMLSTNIGEALPRELVLPIAMTASIAAALWFGLSVIVREPTRRGLVLTALWPPFFFYGPIVDSLRGTSSYSHALGLLMVISALVVMLIPALALTVVLRRAASPMNGATNVLNSISMCALLVTGATAAYGLMQQRAYGLSRQMEQHTHHLSAGRVEADPDIYYIIFDAYTRADYLRKVFDYDISGFLEGLTDRGFYIADKSRSNYPRTQMSLASSLNLNYLDDDLMKSAFADWNNAVPILAQQIWDNKVVSMLKERNYEFVTFISGVVATQIPQADRIIRPGRPYRLLFTEFQEEFFNLTPLRSLLDRLNTPRRHLATLFILDALSELEREERPVFVFAHLMAPHLPHLFDADGHPLDSRPPYHEGYRNEVNYLNKEITKVVDRILDRQPNSIIILQGDHGPWSDWRVEYGWDLPPWKGTFGDYVRDRTAILNAYYFPSQEYEELLSPDITPVNTFRMIFNHAFGTDYERLEDLSYIESPDDDEILRIVDVY